MTENEPLKGKKFNIIDFEDLKEGISASVEFHSDFLFYFEDVKSAVKGLLEEIDSSYGCIHHRKEGGDDECIICVAIGQTLNEVKRKIRKWFADVLEGNKNGKE